MVTRTIKSTITFKHSFDLPSFDEKQAAGTYTLETDEEQIEGLSFLAYRRVASFLHLPAIGSGQARQQVIAIDPEDLKAALERDGRASDAEPAVHRDSATN
jgi:hypothetical protein